MAAVAWSAVRDQCRTVAMSEKGRGGTAAAFPSLTLSSLDYQPKTLAITAPALFTSLPGPPAGPYFTKSVTLIPVVPATI